MKLNTNKKMMVSLCGLALSSLFVLNNKAVVHADTINDANSQNNAISWNSDSDAAQNVQNTQKVDDDQQNAAQSMQSHVETSNVESSTANRSTAVQNNAANARTVQDIKVANVDTAQLAVVKQSQANYSETLSNLGTNANLGDLGVYDVSSDGVKSNIQSQVQNQLAIDDASLANFNMNKDASGNLTASFGVYSNRAKQQNWWTNVKVNNTVVPGIQWRTNEGAASDGNLHLASTGQPIIYSVNVHKLNGTMNLQNNQLATINNPNNNQVHVHYINMNGQVIGTGDYTININNSSSGSYKVPAGYRLASGDGEYNMNYSSQTKSSFKGYRVTRDSYTSGGNYLGQYDPNDPARNGSGHGTADDIAGQDGHGGYYAPTGTEGAFDKTYSDSGLRSMLGTGDYLYVIPQESDYLGHALYLKDGVIEQSTSRYNSHRSQINGEHIYRILSTKSIPSGTGFDTSPLAGLSVQDMGEAPTEIWNAAISFGNSNDGTAPIWIRPENSSYRVVNSKFNSNSVQSVNGNTVNVVLTKPQVVNGATDARLQSHATRTIQINFPGSIPPSYKNIVNDKGVLTQTVNFTRTATEDMLTGNIIKGSEGPWKSDNQDHNFIGFEARTLPRIPGYTLKISPVSA